MVAFIVFAVVTPSTSLLNVDLVSLELLPSRMPQEAFTKESGCGLLYFADYLIRGVDQIQFGIFLNNPT